MAELDVPAVPPHLRVEHSQYGHGLLSVHPLGPVRGAEHLDKDTNGRLPIVIVLTSESIFGVD